LVFGGGGLYFVAWQLAYLEGITDRGVDLSRAEIVVGTSAGSMVASLVSGGHLGRAGDELGFLAKHPGLVGRMAASGELAPSQQRALWAFGTAADSDPDTIREIGHAALAAQAPPPQKLRRSVSTVLGMRRWPSPALHTTAVDAFTGERLVVTKDAGVPVAVAVAASSSVPGLFSPQQLHDRRAMDGGVSGSGTHTDLVAGVGRCLVLAMDAHLDLPDPRMTVRPDTKQREMNALAAAGTEARLRGPTDVDEERLMDPTAVAEARALGARQAEADAEDLVAFWS